MNNILSTAYGDFWTAILISILIFLIIIIWVANKARQAVSDDIDIVFKNRTIEAYNKEEQKNISQSTE